MRRWGYRRWKRKFGVLFSDEMLLEAIYCLEVPTRRNIAAVLNCTRQSVDARMAIINNEGNYRIWARPERAAMAATMFETDWRPTEWLPSSTRRPGLSPSPTS